MVNQPNKDRTITPPNGENKKDDFYSLDELRHMIETNCFPNPFRIDLFVGCIVREFEKLQIDNKE